LKAKATSRIFLKSIHIQGFKSFADKVRFDLQPGLCVIVGPNGCGKSNVADAVRWVLGEQSAKSLRGNKMEDVIFAGSSTRRPVGMAEVSLVFDNSTGLFPLDFEEVIITRRVFRDGEGQFFINKTPCRLKDIQELFLDTGSGKEGFSIIGQGRVEEILNLKAEERRLLIEEVAGISKFRLRKKEAVKKLEDTKQNIDRLNDILTEVQARLAPLARQAEIAQKSEELKNELRETEIKLLVQDLSEIKVKLTKVQTEGQTLQDQLAELNTALAEAENKNIHVKYKLNLLEETIQELQTSIYSLENSISDKEHALSLAAEREEYTKDQLERLEKEISLAKEEESAFKKKEKELLEREGFLKDKLAEASVTLKELEKQLLVLRETNGESRLEELKTEIFEELSLKSKLANELAELEHKKDSLQRQEGQLTESIAAREREIESLAMQIEKLDQELLELEDLAVNLTAKAAVFKQQLTAKEKELMKIEENKTSLLRQLDQIKARQRALQTLEANLEGYNKGVREIVLAFRKGELKNCVLYGTVAENILVEPKYELALETALGLAMQYIIVDSTEDGKEGIAYLKKTKNGRATFLPRLVLQGKKALLTSRTLDHPGFLGLAVDLIKCDPRFKPVFQNLLGRILVADSMDSAVTLAKQNNYRFKVVTLQGDQVNPGGSLTGGSVRNQESGLLGRKRQIERLVLEAQEIQKALEAKERDLINCSRELETLKTKIKDLDREIESCQNTKNILTVDRKHLRERNDRLQESLKLLKYNLSDVINQFSGLDHNIADIKARINDSTHRIASLQNEQKDLEELLKKTNAQGLVLTERITEARVEVARWEQELAQIQDRLGEGRKLVQTNSLAVREKKNEWSALKQKERDLSAEQEELKNELRGDNAFLEEKKQELIRLRSRREKKSTENLKYEEDIRQLTDQIKKTEKLLYQNEIELTRLQTEEEAELEKLRAEFSCSIEDALAYQSGENRATLNERLKNLRQEVENLGLVNYAALKEYPETLERFDFLSAQKNDLVAAADSLYSLISELDESMIKRFAKGFKDVNKAFQEVFKELFNGGQAELILDDPDNLLETGVKIIAQPPGKKAQLLSLLSGGERAFTAIALLFAFLKVKPSPFCLLDEIEAALDEVNVKRFINYLQSLSFHTQFILISHRRGTMEAANKLFGITMEETGVSKLLTVEMKDKIDPEIA
jgi:chromosome segregation protein